MSANEGPQGQRKTNIIRNSAKIFVKKKKTIKKYPCDQKRVNGPKNREHGACYKKYPPLGAKKGK